MDNNRPDNHSIYNEEVDLSKQSHNILVCIIQELGYRLFLRTVNCEVFLQGKVWILLDKSRYMYFHLYRQNHCLLVEIVENG